jgi:hypothetical protein
MLFKEELDYLQQQWLGPSNVESKEGSFPHKGWQDFNSAPDSRGENRTIELRFLKQTPV